MTGKRSFVVVVVLFVFLVFSSVAEAANLSVSRAGNGNGTVTSSPAGINCGDVCAHGFNDGARVILTAKPSIDSRFIGWSGNCSGTGKWCTLVLKSSAQATATFTRKQFAVKSSVWGGHGTASPSSQVTGYGASASIAITPDSGYAIKKITDNGRNVAVANPYVISSIVKAHKVVVSFKPAFTLSVTKSGTGGGTVASSPAGINCGSTCGYDFLKNSTVTLTATPDTTSTFSGWSGACTGTAPCKLAMTSNKTASATFTRNGFTVTSSISGGSGTVTPSYQTVTYGGSASVTITPDTGYNIAVITDNGASIPIVNPYTISNITAHHDIAVTFSPCTTDCVLDSTYFGFDANAANNYNAMRAMEDYANSNGSIAVRFRPGTYTVQLPASGEPGYRGGGQGACSMANVNGVTIDASQAVFYTPSGGDITKDITEQSLFLFNGCNDINIKANFKGVHQGHTHLGIKGIYLKSNNSNADLTITSERMFDGIRVGNWEDPAQVSGPIYEGNHDITIDIKSVDTYYTAALYLTNNATITSEAKGTAEGNYGAYRAVYLNGCTNVNATSKTMDMNVSDGVNIIGSAPQWSLPQHVGCSNITMNATDMGTTHYVQYQSLVKLNVVTSSVIDTSIIHKNININVDIKETDTIWTNNRAVAIGAIGEGASHRYEDVTISGTVDRQTANTSSAISVETLVQGLSYFGLTLRGFHDLFDPQAKPYTINVGSALPTVEIEAYDSDVGTVYLSDKTKQTFVAY